MIGTVPYLGLYLSDLTYIDSAFPNTINIENNTDDSPNSTVKLINFEKHRKEFEVLAQIKLFQSAANSYTNFQPVPRFKIWFDNVRTYTESERFVEKQNKTKEKLSFSLQLGFVLWNWTERNHRQRSNISK